MMSCLEEALYKNEPLQYVSGPVEHLSVNLSKRCMCGVHMEFFKLYFCHIVSLGRCVDGIRCIRGRFTFPGHTTLDSHILKVYLTHCVYI